MHRTRLIAVATLLASVACSPPNGDAGADAAAGAPATDTSEIAAEVNGVAITTDELDTWIKEDFFRSEASNPNSLYQLRDTALRRLVAERSLDAAASQAGVSPERLIADKVASLGAVTDAETLEFFEANKSRVGSGEFEGLEEQIREFLTTQREAQARSEIEKEANVVVHLEPPRITVAADGPTRGPADAPITIVEFSDFQCPYCRRVIPTLQQIEERYPEQIRIVFRNFPLANHSRAKPAAEAALCAHEQDQFWAYHDKLFENSRALSGDDFKRYAGDLDLDVAAFEACLDESRFTAQVETDLRDARDAGVTGTPAFFVNGVMLSGAKPASDFFRTIDAELERLKEGA
ncbi:MAG: thioredoxin domain-containing protein [Deltaproteobacteria bacterium]|nr:thioredoxin domain-containing protein [Deltaproteobacteria bacterium]MBW2360162.1 thioredoxin domain-containing protein [Deltaproteobacteria bacterium]